MVEFPIPSNCSSILKPLSALMAGSKSPTKLRLSYSRKADKRRLYIMQIMTQRVCLEAELARYTRRWSFARRIPRHQFCSQLCNFVAPKVNSALVKTPQIPSAKHVDFLEYSKVLMIAFMGFISHNS